MQHLLYCSAYICIQSNSSSFILKELRQTAGAEALNCLLNEVVLKLICKRDFCLLLSIKFKGAVCVIMTVMKACSSTLNHDF